MTVCRVRSTVVDGDLDLDAGARSLAKRAAPRFLASSGALTSPARRRRCRAPAWAAARATPPDAVAAVAHPEQVHGLQAPAGGRARPGADHAAVRHLRRSRARSGSGRRGPPRREAASAAGDGCEEAGAIHAPPRRSPRLSGWRDGHERDRHAVPADCCWRGELGVRGDRRRGVARAGSARASTRGSAARKSRSARAAPPRSRPGAPRGRPQCR